LPAEFGYLDDLRAGADDDQALRRLVEEVIRFGTPFPMKPLIALAEARIGDLVIPAGSVVNLWFAAANRDQAVNGGLAQADPALFDPARWPNRHVGFGHGPHYCLGADLGRLETFVLLQETVGALPGLEMDDTKPFRRFAGIVDGVTEAHFRFDQKAARRLQEASK
jgi:cytochrome P450